MKKVFAECGEGCYIELPFRANFGGHHVHMGDYVYANYNLTLVDDGHIYIGSNVMFGPNVTIATANHPIDASLRRRGLQYNKDVYIGENTWIGAGAVGNPCRVLREIGEHDKEFFYKNEAIDWEEL